MLWCGRFGEGAVGVWWEVAGGRVLGLSDGEAVTGDLGADKVEWP